MFTSRDSDLGYDPTITALPSTTGVVRRYDITVHSENGETHAYRTIELLGNSGGRHLLGRGTRVWKAVRVVNGEEVGEPVALKDVWVDDHRQREGHIYNCVSTSAASLNLQKDLQSATLTVLAHGDVIVNGIRDSRLMCYLTSSPSAAVTAYELGASTTKPRIAKTQVHYRIVFKEIGTPISRITAPTQVFNALRHACIG